MLPLKTTALKIRQSHGESLRTRFAPTPSGYLHAGNAFSFLITWLIARFSGGKILLRIDDNDALRAREAYLDDIFESLLWLGLDYDEGAKNTADFRENYSQTLRKDYYLSFLKDAHLKKLLFACDCSRKSFSGNYPGTCLLRALDFDTPDTALRINTLSAKNIIFEDALKSDIFVNLHEIMPFFILRTKNLLPAYQLVSVIEDTENSMNFIVRGEDLLPSTAAQLFFAGEIAALHNFRNTLFLHHALLKDDSGNKLSKSEGAFSLRDMRRKHADPKQLFLHFSHLLNFPPLESASEMLKFLSEKEIS